MSEVSADNLRAQSHVARRDVLPIPYSARVRPRSCCWHPWEERPALQMPCPAPRGSLLHACHAVLHGALCWDVPEPARGRLRFQARRREIQEFPDLHCREWGWCSQGVKGGHISCGQPTADLILPPQIPENGNYHRGLPVPQCSRSYFSGSADPPDLASDVSASSGVGAFQRKQDPASPRSCF